MALDIGFDKKVENGEQYVCPIHTYLRAELRSSVL